MIVPKRKIHDITNIFPIIWSFFPSFYWWRVVLMSIKFAFTALHTKVCIEI